LAYTHTGYNAMSGGLHAMQAALPGGWAVCDSRPSTPCVWVPQGQ